MINRRILLALCVATSMWAASCSGGKTDKGTGDAPVKEQAAAQQEAATNAGAVKTRTPEALLAELPCKMQGKRGAYAVFPDNDVAGQICFKLGAISETEAKIPSFDIHGGNIYVIFHYEGGDEPGEITLARWEDRDGAPCVEDACGTAIATKSEKYSPADEAGWTYVIATPETPLDLAAGDGSHIGLLRPYKALPLFR